MKTFTLAASAAFLSLMGSSALAQAPAPACTSDIHDDFDFWVGEWNVYAPGNEEGLGPYVGHNTVARIHGGCLITEHWVNTAGAGGESMNMYDPLIGAWRQVWMSNGWYIDYTGGLNEDGAMVLTGNSYTIQTDTRAELRGIWTLREDGTVSQEFEQKDAEGHWQNVFTGIYVREQDDPRAEEAEAARTGQ